MGGGVIKKESSVDLKVPSRHNSHINSALFELTNVILNINDALQFLRSTLSVLGIYGGIENLLEWDFCPQAFIDSFYRRGWNMESGRVALVPIWLVVSK